MNQDGGTARDNAIDAPHTDPSGCEEQNGSMKPPPSTDRLQAPPFNHPYQPTHSELPFRQQEVQPTLLGPSTPAWTLNPSLPPNPPTGHPPPASTQGMAPTAGGAVLSVDPSALAALRQPICHCVLLPGALASPTEEVTRDHSTAELVTGQCPPIPIGLAVVSGDRLFLDWKAFPISVTREDYC